MTDEENLQAIIANQNGRIANLQDENEQLKLDIKWLKAQIVIRDNELKQCQKALAHRTIEAFESREE